MKKPEAVIQGCSVKKVLLKILQIKGEFCKIFKNIFFQRAIWVAAFEKLKAKAVVQRCSVKSCS